MNLLAWFKVVSFNISTEFLTEIKPIQNIVQGQQENATARDICTGILTKVNSK